MNENVISITPHDGQVGVLQSKKKLTLALAGIQGGKTFIGCIWSQLQAQRVPFGNHLICGLSKDQLNNVVVDKFFELFPTYRPLYNKREMTVYLPGGGRFIFRSLDDPKYTEGITAHSAWIDEGDLISYNAYLVVRGRTNATDGPILITSSIAENSWLVDYLEKIDDKYVKVVTWKSKDNPAFSDEEWEMLKQELDPALFRRRYEADPRFSSGKVYALFDPKKHLVDSAPPKEMVKTSFIGIDWGYVDPTAIVVLQLDKDGKVYVVDEFVVEGAPLDLIVKVIQKFKKTYDVKGIYADPSNKLFLKTVEKRIPHTIVAGHNDIFDGTSLIRNLIFQDRFYMVRSKTPVSQREIKMYRFLEKLSGRAEVPEDKHNHCMDAIRYPLATYPIPGLKSFVKEQAEEPMTAFWMRRTSAYQNAKRQFDITKIRKGNNIWMP